MITNMKHWVAFFPKIVTLFELKSNILLVLTAVTRIFGSGGPKPFFVPNQLNCIKIYNKAIFQLQWFFASELYRKTINGMHLYSIVILISLWKFDWKVLSQLNICRGSLFIWTFFFIFTFGPEMFILFSNKSFH
jgi:hypothetical protein